MTATNPSPAPSDPTEHEVMAVGDSAPEGAFDQRLWEESRADDGPATPEGRRILAAALAVLAILWVAYMAWSAGRALSNEPLTSPTVAQWIAMAAGPLGLFGLAWLVFGRTRRKEAEEFTRSVVKMRSEARSLEALLEVLSRRITDSRSELVAMTEELVALGDQTTGKLAGITSEFDSSNEKLRVHADALDRAADSARNDVAVLLEDLPRAEEHSRSISTQLRAAAADTESRTQQFERQLAALAEQTREADEAVSSASQRLVTYLTQIESAGAAAAERVGEAEGSFNDVIGAMLGRTSEALDEIRSGIDTQARAVTALVDQASSGIGRAGVDASKALADNLQSAEGAIESLSARVAEQERASQRMIAEIDRTLGEVDERFSAIAKSGDEHAGRFLELLARTRTELQSIAETSETQDDSLVALAERSESLRAAIERLAANVRAHLGGALDEATGQADRLVNTARALRPEIEWMHDAARETDERIGSTGSAIAEQQDRLTALLGTIEGDLDSAKERLSQFASAISDAQSQASEFRAQTGPELVEAMVQIREAAGHAAQRAREAIDSIIPESAEGFGAATREALERVIRDSIEERLRDVEAVAARAVDSARTATERLAHQMLVLGQSATALEEHIEKQQEERREADSEAFGRRVSLLIDSMHSASIDVGKILADEVDEKAWESYLKGDRGVFTRRAARLIGGSETRAIRSHYESDAEFKQSVNRYIHDFEAMLRRVLADRDGGMIAVTLMSSDMGKLYAALADALDRRR